MPSLTFRPTTAEDVLTLNQGEPLPWRVRATTALLDGEPIAYAGLCYQPTGAIVAFTRGPGLPRLRAYPKAMHQAALKGLAEARARGVACIFATADPDVEAAERWLLRLGFHPTVIDGEKAFCWTHGT